MRYILSFLLLLPLVVSAQDEGQLSGSFQLNFSAYDVDSVIGTYTTQYFHEKSSSEAWLFLNYRYKGFDFASRFDAFNNSPLINPQEAYTAQGIGFYQVSKSVGNLELTGGYFYDQIGSGLIFRAFEDRNLGLDYSVQGIRARYQTKDGKLNLKVFSGLQKNRLERHPQVLKGLNGEYAYQLGNRIQMVTGAGLINRTLDQATMVDLASTINALPFEERFQAPYNVYSGTVYNTLQVGNLSLYGEYARKTREAVFIYPATGEPSLEFVDGQVAFGVVNLNIPALNVGLSLQYKYIDTFVLRTSPYNNLLVGLVNYLPPLSRQQSLRLPARYSIAALPQGEKGFQAELTYTPNKRTSYLLNASDVVQPDGRQLYRELFFEYSKRFNRDFSIELGAQTVLYDQEVYQQKPRVPLVEAATPFFEFSYRLNSFYANSPAKLQDSSGNLQLRKYLASLKPSIRGQLQYLRTEEDFGDFIFAMLELNLAPRLSFSVSDMINSRPTKGDDITHYYTLFAAYSNGPTRLTAGYIKQVEGVVCTGGVCRVEPAFSGFRASLFTNF